jgi:predicted nicotinamide N-methyase
MATSVSGHLYVQLGDNENLMFSLEAFHKDYETDTKHLGIRGRNFRFFVPKTIDGFIDPQDVLHDFPLWSKIWEAAIVLADYLAGITVDPERRFLEIGCGLGLVGIVASSFGHRVTMTETNAHALDFARANAEINSPATKSNLEILKLDWNRPRLRGVFDTIVGSEIVYNERNYQPIIRLLKTYLRPGGEIILAEGIKKTSIEFFRQMEEVFCLKAQKKVLRSKEQEIRVILCRMRFK